MTIAVVVGAGAAGLAAAWAASQRGDRVTIVDGGAGASALGGGALDDQPWDQWQSSADRLNVALTVPDLPNELRTFSNALGIWNIPKVGSPAPLVATRAGVLRPTVGHDRCLLDLAALPLGATVVLPRVERAEWDADGLVRVLSVDPAAVARGLRFEVVDAVVVRYADERVMAEADLAHRHNDPARAEWLGQQLRTLVKSRQALQRPVDAILLGGWLGTNSDCEHLLRLRDQVGVPVGEALTSVGGAAGLRFEAAKDDLLERSSISHLRDRATRLERGAAGLDLTMQISSKVLTGIRRLVLATGGIAAGGIEFSPPGRIGDDNRCPSPAFRLTIETGFELALDALDAKSRFGPELDRIAWPEADVPGALEEVGIRSEALADDVRAVGDVRARRPRTMLEAVRSGLTESFA